MQYLDDVTNVSSQVIFLQFFPKFSGSLLMAKRPLYQQICSLPCIFTQNMLCEAELTLVLRSYFVFEKMFE